MNTFHWNILSLIEIFKNKKGYFIRFLKIFLINVKMSLSHFLTTIYDLFINFCGLLCQDTQCEYCLWAGFCISRSEVLHSFNGVCCLDMQCLMN